MSSSQNPEQSSMESTEEVREGAGSEWQSLSRNGPVILLWLSWTISCAVITAAVMSIMSLQFLGEFVLGGVFGVVQWLVLWTYLGRLYLWAPVSLLGWFVGISMAILVVPLLGPELTALAGRHEALAYNIVLEPIRYAALGFAQWLLLRSYLHRAGWWVLASAIGGLLGTTALMGLQYGGASIRFVYAGVPGLIYGAITGAALVWLVGRQRSVNDVRQTTTPS